MMRRMPLPTVRDEFAFVTSADVFFLRLKTAAVQRLFRNHEKEILNARL
jgi:hypothetical protein